MKSKIQSGFALVALIIVLAIIAILAALYFKKSGPKQKSSAEVGKEAIEQTKINNLEQQQQHQLIQDQLDNPEN